MRIPLDAEVKCKDGYWGHSTCLIVKPDSKDLTHFVVREGKFLENERLVPVDLIAETTEDTIALHCSKEELDNLPTFIKTHFVRKEIPQYDMIGDNASYLEWPIVTYQTVKRVEEHIPLGGLTFHKGCEVHALDGNVGSIYEFIVDSSSRHITHLILDERHLLGKQHIVISVSDVGRIEKDHVYLNLSRAEIHQMPHHREVM